MFEWFDQALHYALGRAMAQSLRGLLPPEEVVEKVMEFAEYRELLQHPDGHFGAGSRRDLKWWRKGAESGAGIT